LKAAAVDEEESGRQLESRSENDGGRVQIHAEGDEAHASKDEDGELRQRARIQETDAEEKTTGRQYAQPSAIGSAAGAPRLAYEHGQERDCRRQRDDQPEIARRETEHRPQRRARLACAFCLSRMARNCGGIRKASQQARAADISCERRPKAESQRTGAARSEAVYLPAIEGADVEPEDDDQRDQNRKVLDADAQPQDDPGQQRSVPHEQIQRQHDSQDRQRLDLAMAGRDPERDG
jgi:hypothetical protein